jgi:hypothetical protein
MSNLPVLLPYQSGNSVMVEGREVARALRGNGVHLRNRLGNLLGRISGKVSGLMAYLAAMGVHIPQPSGSASHVLQRYNGPPSTVILNGYGDLDRQLQHLQRNYHAGDASRRAQEALSLLAALHGFAVNSAETATKMEAMTKELLAKYQQAVAQDPTNAAAYENAEHLRRLMHWLRANARALEDIGVDPSVLGAAMAASDVGKGGSLVPALAQDIMPGAFASGDKGKIGGACFSSFLLHEVHGTLLIDELAKKHGIDQRTARAIVVANVGHNGPATSGSWWESNWNNLIASLNQGDVELGGHYGNVVSKYIGKSYPDVGNMEAAVHASLDRIDQGTGGCFKIFVDVVNAGMAMQAAFNEAFVNNPRSTLNQIQELKRAFPELSKMDFMKKGERAVQCTPGHYSPMVRFSGDKTEVLILSNSRRFVAVGSPDELIVALRVHPPPNDWV